MLGGHRFTWQRFGFRTGKHRVLRQEWIQAITEGPDCASELPASSLSEACDEVMQMPKLSVSARSGAS